MTNQRGQNAPDNNPLSTFLRGLTSTGPTGFEGLIAHLLESELGQRFRLAASGFQAGMDAETEPGSAYANCIKVETKHYFKSKLSLRELTAEIIQASRNDECDLWILGCTCAVPAQHATKLEQLASDEGIECLFLDSQTTGIDRITVLIASHEMPVIHWASQANIQFDEVALRAYLATIRDRSDFETIRTQLRTKLAGTLVGYVDAVRRSWDELFTVLSDAQTCEAIFNQDVAILTPDTRHIARNHICTGLDAWWRQGIPVQPHQVVLGEEGQGKTWAIMGWLLGLPTNQDGPLILACNASVSINAGDTIDALLPRLLCSWTQLKTTEWWSKRLRNWLGSPSTAGPSILVLIDGLNESENVDWIDFFRPIQHVRWRGRIAVLATDRPSHWQRYDRLHHDGFRVLPIAGYSNEELQAQLAMYPTIDLSQIPEGLQPLLRNPRYFELVADHYEALVDSQDFTHERLILLDAADRQSRKRGYPLGQQELIAIIQGLARQYRNTSTLDDPAVISLLSGINDSRRVRQEVIDGGLLVPIESAVGSRYRVETHRLTFGLGLLLADNVREHARSEVSTHTIAEEIENWFEPHPEMELKVQTSAAAVYHSFLDASFPTVGRRELIKYWLSSRNAGLAHDEARLGIVLRGPDEFIQVAEDLWNSDRQRSAAQDFLGASFCRYRDHPAVQPLLIPAVYRWMGYVHPAGHRLFRGQSDSDVQSIMAEITDRAGHELVPGPMTFLGQSLTVIEDEGLQRLVRLGIRILSAGSLEPYIQGVFAWAAAGALMGHALEGSELAWVIRLAQQDLEPPILPIAEQHFASQNECAHHAGRLLTDILGTAAATHLRECYRETEDPRYLARLEQHRANPCESLFTWSDSECEQCLNNESTPTHLLIDRASLQLLDPTRPPHNRVAEYVREQLSELSPSSIRLNIGVTSEDHRLQRIFPIAAAQVPGVLAQFMRSVIQGMPQRDTRAQRQLALELPRYVPLLQTPEMNALRQTLSMLRASSAQWPTDERVDSDEMLAEAYITWSLLPTFAAEIRYEDIIGRPSNAYDLETFSQWFGPLASTQVDAIFEDLEQNPDRQHIVRALWQLGSSGAIIIEAQRHILRELGEHSDPVIRALVARCAVLLPDEELARSLAEADRIIDVNMHRWEARWCFRLLNEYSDRLPLVDIMTRLDASLASYLVAARGLNENEVAFYANSLDQVWTFVGAAPHPTLSTPLPGIVVDPASDQDPTGLPEIPQERTPSWQFRDSSTSWKDAGEGIPDIGSNSEAEFDALIARFHESQEAVLTAWQFDALRCFGRTFSNDALRAICRARPDLTKQWVSAATQAGSEGDALMLRFGSFLVCLCEALFTTDDELALVLFQALKSSNGLVTFDAAPMLFRIPRSEFVDSAREDLLSKVVDDEELAHFAYLAQAADDGWLDTAIEHRVNSPYLGQTAYGLAMASYRHSSKSEFDRLIEQASIEGTWIEQHVLPTLRRNHMKDRIARLWFERFLYETDERSWAAFEVAVHLADERWFLWAGSDAVSATALGESRFKFIEMNKDYVQRHLRRERERKDYLFGIKISRGEIFPF